MLCFYQPRHYQEKTKTMAHKKCLFFQGPVTKAALFGTPAEELMIGGTLKL